MRGFTQNHQIGTALPLAVMNRIRRQNGGYFASPTLPVIAVGDRRLDSLLRLTRRTWFREEGRWAPRYGARARATGARGLRLGGAELGGGNVGPRVAVRARRAYRGGGGEREGGMDLRGGQGQRPFLAVGRAAAMAVGKGQQAPGLGIMFRACHRSSR